MVSPTLATWLAVVFDDAVFDDDVLDEDEEMVVATEESVVATDVGSVLADDELFVVLVF